MTFEAKEKVLPEYMRVKHELLDDFFFLKDLFFEGQRKPTPQQKDRIKAQMLILYTSIKFKGGKKKAETALKVLSYMKNAESIEDMPDTIKELFKLYSGFQQYFDAIGLTRITYKGQNPNKAFDY